MAEELKVRTALSGKLPKDYNPYKMPLEFCKKFIEPEIKKRKRYWIIRTLDSKGTVLRDNGKILFFKTPDEARRHIEEKCGNSPYLMIKLWRNRKKL